MANNNSVGGIGLGGLLFITFLVLKFTGVITWSWWWVTAPIWCPLVIILGIVLALVVLAVSK